MKGEKVHKTPNYDTEMKLCFFSMGCFTVPCTRLILGITLCCSRQSLNPEHVKGIEPFSLGYQSQTCSSNRALRRGWQRKSALWLALHILIHASQALGKVCPSLLQKASCSVPSPRGPWGVSSTMELRLLLWVLLGELGFGVSTSTQRLPFSIPRGLLGKGDESWHG